MRSIVTRVSLFRSFCSPTGVYTPWFRWQHLNSYCSWKSGWWLFLTLTSPPKAKEEYILLIRRNFGETYFNRFSVESFLILIFQLISQRILGFLTRIFAQKSFQNFNGRLRVLLRNYNWFITKMSNTIE